MTKRWVGLVVILAVVGSLCLGCAHRQHVKAGDEAMDANDPVLALEQYRRAQVERPQSDSIANRIDEAEGAVLREVLLELEEAMREPAVRRTLSVAKQAVERIEDPQRLDELEARVESFIIETARSRSGERDYRGALALIEEHIDIFGHPLQPVVELREEIEEQWGTALRGAAERQLQEGRYGTAAVYFTMADAAVDRDVASDDSVNAMWRVFDSDGWRIRGVGGEMLNLERILDGLFQSGLPAPIRDGRRSTSDGLEAELRIEVGDLSFRQWETTDRHTGEYRVGTKSVVNPAYQRLEDEVHRKERAVLDGEHAVTRARHDLWQAQRELRERRREGRSMRFAENRVDRARRDLHHRERRLADLRNEKRHLLIDLRDIDRYVEEPVYGVHVYEVSLKKAEMSADVRAVIEVPTRGFERAVTFDLAEQAVARRHDAQPELNLEARDERPPSEAELRAKLQRSVGGEMASFVKRAFQGYREAQMEPPRDSAIVDEIDMLSRAILMDPWDRNPDWEDRLDELVDLERTSGLLIRMAREALRAQ